MPEQSIDKWTDGLEKGTLGAFFKSQKYSSEVLERVQYIALTVAEIFDLEFNIQDDILEKVLLSKDKDVIDLAVSQEYVYHNPYVKDGVFKFPREWLTQYFEFDVKMAFIHNNEVFARSMKLTKSNIKKLENLKKDMDILFPDVL